MASYSKLNQDLVQQIENALAAVDFGSVEIFVTDKKVTQITVRSIQKTSVGISDSNDISQKKEPNLFTIHARFRRTE